MMDINKLEGLFNPEDIERNTITTGELNSILGNEIAILKVVGVKTEYKDSRVYSNDEKTLRTVLSELRGNTKYSGTPISETTIFIKVLKVTGESSNKHTSYLKLTETVNLNKLDLDFNLYESLIRDSSIRKGLKYSKVSPEKYYVDSYKFPKKIITNRFNDLLGIEFLVTGLGVFLDERANSLDNLIILDGVLGDYK